MIAWPAPVERVSAFLVTAGAEARVEMLRDDCGSAEAAAEALGCSLEQVVKSLVLMCDGRPALALLGGAARAETRLVAALFSSKHARIARPAEVLDATGLEPGAVTPFLGSRLARIVMDERLLSHDVVWCGAGTRQHMAALAPQELARLTQARIATITKA